MDPFRFYLGDVTRLLSKLPVEQLHGLATRLLDVYHQGRQVFLMGNGGSAATCSHIANDLQKCIYFAGGKTFRAMALTDSVPLITTWANDASYERVFAEQLRPWVRPGDLVFLVSGSGNSPNVLEAAKLAREMGAYTVGLCGFGGGKLAGLADEAVVVNSDSMQRVEDLHMITLHMLFWHTMQAIEREAAAEKGSPTE
jgi:D-sedoheptulose 7-phosphate isomerase